jgi:hypothetical protein
VFGVAVDLRGARAIAGLVIGLTITMDIFVGGGLSGAAMNPARWFGPAIVQGAFADWWRRANRGASALAARLNLRPQPKDSAYRRESSRRTAVAIASPTAAVVTVFSPGRAVSGVLTPSSIASSIATSTARASRSSLSE